MELGMDKLIVNGETYIKEGANTPIKRPDGLTYCIVRTFSAGVFAGYYDVNNLSKIGKVYDARRLWYWEGAASLSQLAVSGTSKPSKCKFPVAVPEILLTEIIEVLPVSTLAKKTIDEVAVWTA